MELNSDSIHDVIHPTAAFSERPVYTSPLENATPSPWSESQLNPKNRIDSLTPPKDALWRIDGSTGLGTQFYALPLFLKDMPPMRFDVYIPEAASKDKLLRELLDLNLAFHTKDAERCRRLGISTHIIRRLQLWTEATDPDGPLSFQKMLSTFPFGSRIVFENLDLDVRKIRMSFGQTHEQERQYLSLPKLRASLRLDAQYQLPPTVDVSDLSHIHQLHDSVCTVRFNAASLTKHPELKLDTETTWIFKTLTSDTKYMYSELRVLLAMPEHDNVMAKPEYLVVKVCNFGNKKGTIGFLLPYHSGGSLRDVVPLLRVNDRLTLDHQLKWALQLTSAVLHVRNQGRIFYPDFRLDNIVLSESWDAIMIDFEQRGVWCEFAAPEVNAVDYIRILATDVPESERDARIPDATLNRYREILSEVLPDWEAVHESDSIAELPDEYNAYNITWLSLSEAEQEACEVYMLGRVLWCLFEGQSIPHTSAVWQSYRYEPDLEWPKFRNTPEPLREIIDRCTAGRRPPMTTLIIRRGSRLVFRHSPPGAEHDPAEVLKAARAWWSAEISHAEEFLSKRKALKDRGQWTGNYYDRPTMKEVMAALQTFAYESGWKHQHLPN